MAFDLIGFTSSLIQKKAVNEILKCNDFTIKYNLVLSPEQAVELAETQNLILKENGRLDFGGGVIDKMIKQFCDSPYISMQNYTETLNELIELFYYYKNETQDRISDDDLIKFMQKAFDGVCRGSIELLSGQELERLAHNLRFGLPANYREPDTEEEDYDEY